MAVASRVGLRVPGTTSGNRAEPVRQVVGFLALVTVLVGLETWVFAQLGLTPPRALTAAAVLYVLLFAMLLPAVRWQARGYFPVQPVVRWTPRAVALWLGVHSTLVSLTWAPPAVSLAIGGLSTVPGLSMGRRSVDGFLANSTAGLARLYEPHDAAAMIATCRRRLDDPQLKPAQRSRTMVNLAHALISDSSLRGHRDRLLEATRLLADVTAAEQGEPDVVLRAAEELMRAMAAKDFKHDDPRGWLDAVGLWSLAASRCDQGPEARAIGLLAEAMRETERTERATSDDDFTRHRQAAIALCRAALSLAPPDSATLDDVKSQLVYLLRGMAASRSELDEAIALGRSLVAQAERDRQGQRGPEARRADTAVLDEGVALAVSLVSRAERVGPSLVGDTEEAIGLCVEALDAPRPRPGAARVLAEALALRDLAGRPIEAFVAAVGRLDAAAALRFAFEAELARSHRHGHDMAAIWADWARQADRPDDAAEAFWRLVTLLPSESVRRHGLAARHRLVGSLQGLATEAGYWLARAGRHRDAVVAVEHGRAVLSATALRSGEPGLEARLAVKGRPDLWRRWRHASAQLDAVHRSQHAESVGTTTPGRSPYESPEQAVWTEREHVLDEIADVLGVRPDAILPTYEMLREAIGNDVVVYLGAALRGGFALVVGRGVDPVHVELPALVAGVVDERVSKVLEAGLASTGTWPSTLTDTMAWLESGVDLAGVLRSLPGGEHVGEVVVVPLGPLALLPIHAMTLTTEPPVVVRYAPNARSAARAREIAQRTSASPPTVLAVDAPHVPGEAPLPAAAVETRHVARLYGPACRRLNDASEADLTEYMPDTSIWHFACHGIADVGDPLESALVLADGRLTLGEVKARLHGEHRLAVLSACETGMPDLDLLDEVMSLAGSLLDAGVAGVVASQWKVDDTGAALQMLFFHERLLQGCPPAKALVGAQTWIRRATNGDLHAAYPQLVAPPAGLPTDAMREWATRQPYRHPRHWAAFSFTGT